jgi:hypothetical protein
MKNKNLLWILPVAMLLASCGVTTPTSSPAASSPTPTTSSTASSGVSTSSATVSSASSSSSSSTIASSSEASSSSSEQASSSTSLTTSSSSSVVTPALLLTPEEFDTASKGYPAAGEKLFSGTTLYVEDVMLSSANPVKEDGTILKNTNIPTIQMKAVSGVFYNTKAASFSKVVVTQFDTTNAYNLAYSQPSLFYGDEANPSTNFVKGEYVAGLTEEGYKTYIGTYTLDKAYSFIRFLNDASSVENQTRAFKGLSIALYA